MIFVDTGAWFALAVRNDPDHSAAIKWLAQNREPLITTDYILAETATLIRMRDKTPRGHRLAVRCASSILKQEASALHRVAEHNFNEPLSFFRVYRDHLFSFVDCASLRSWKNFASITLSPLMETSMNILALLESLARKFRLVDPKGLH